MLFCAKQGWLLLTKTPERLTNSHVVLDSTKVERMQMGGNAGGNEDFINSKILVECAPRKSYRVQVGASITKPCSDAGLFYFLP
jgi:hypothetical protein